MTSAERTILKAPTPISSAVPRSSSSVVAPAALSTLVSCRWTTPSTRAARRSERSRLPSTRLWKRWRISSSFARPSSMLPGSDATRCSTPNGPLTISATFSGNWPRAMSRLTSLPCRFVCTTISRSGVGGIDGFQELVAHGAGIGAHPGHGASACRRLDDLPPGLAQLFRSRHPGPRGWHGPGRAAHCRATTAAPAPFRSARGRRSGPAPWLRARS